MPIVLSVHWRAHTDAPTCSIQSLSYICHLSTCSIQTLSCVFITVLTLNTLCPAFLQPRSRSTHLFLHFYNRAHVQHTFFCIFTTALTFNTPCPALCHLSTCSTQTLPCIYRPHQKRSGMFNEYGTRSRPTFNEHSRVKVVSACVFALANQSGMFY